MPRRKPVSDVQREDAVIPMPMLPPARTVHRTHEVDPYEVPPGAVRATVIAEEKVAPTSGRLKKRDAAQIESAIRAQRYDLWLEARARHGEDIIAALAEVYNITEDQARANRFDLLTDVRSGKHASAVGDVLEEYDLGVRARVAILSRHAYSDNPAAALKSVDMANELQGTHAEVGRFEEYLRLAKLQKKKSA